MSRTPKGAEDRREQILDAALRVFAKKGFTKATNKDIAREAGITTGLIYHYFESKEALLKAIFDERSPLQLIRSIPPAMLDQPPEQFLPFFVNQMLAVVEDERTMQLVRVYLPEAIYNPQSVPVGAAAITEGTQFLAGYLQGKMNSGEIRQVDAGLVASIFLGSIFDIALRRKALVDGQALQYTREQIAETAVSFLLHGLLPQ